MMTESFTAIHKLQLFGYWTFCSVLVCSRPFQIKRAQTKKKNLPPNCTFPFIHISQLTHHVINCCLGKDANLIKYREKRANNPCVSLKDLMLVDTASRVWRLKRIKYMLQLSPYDLRYSHSRVTLPRTLTRSIIIHILNRFCQQHRLNWLEHMLQAVTGIVLFNLTKHDWCFASVGAV